MMVHSSTSATGDEAPILKVQGLVFAYPARRLFDGWCARFVSGLHLVCASGRADSRYETISCWSAKDGAKPRRCLISMEQYEAMKASGELK